MNQEKLEEILESAICPKDALDLEFEQFIDKRNKMLLDYARSLVL